MHCLMVLKNFVALIHFPVEQSPRKLNCFLAQWVLQIQDQKQRLVLTLPEQMKSHSAGRMAQLCYQNRTMALSMLWSLQTDLAWSQNLMVSLILNWSEQEELLENQSSPRPKILYVNQVDLLLRKIILYSKVVPEIYYAVAKIIIIIIKTHYCHHHNLNVE